MATVGEAVIDISADGAGEAQSALSSVGGALSSLGTIAIGVAAAGLAALGAGLTFAVNEMMDAQDAVTALNTVLESTGGAVGLTSQQLQDMASALQNVTRFSDEAAMAAETMLLRYENLGADVFPQALAAAADLATAMGTDLTAAAMAVGRALDNPAEGLGRLNTQLRLFTEAEMDAIEEMAEMGDVAGAQALILERLGEKVGGAAEAMGTTLAGRVEILKNRISDLGETVGGVLVPYLEDAMSAAEFFVNAISAGASPLAALSGALRAVGLGDFADGLRNANDALRPLGGPLRELGDAFATVAPAFLEAGAQIGAAFQTAFAAVGPEVMANLQTALSALADAVVMYGPIIADALGFIGSILAGSIGAAATAVSGLVAALLQLATGDTQGAIETFTNAASNAFMTFANSVSQAVGGVDFSTVIATWQGNFANLAAIVTTVGGLIGAAIANIAASVESGLNNVVTDIVNAATSIGNTAGEWAAAGGKLIVSLAGAIRSGASAVVEAAIAVAKAAIAALLAELQISSPSRIMLEVGANLTGTLADAISGGIPGTARAAGNLGLAVGEAVSAPLAGLPPMPGGERGAGGNSTVINLSVVAHDVQDTIEAIDRELANRGQSLAGATSA
jgi:hypothetical protein